MIFRSMQKIYDLFWSLVWSIGYLHEICHYIPASYFQLKPILKRDRVEYDEGTFTQHIIISSAPILVGFALLYPATQAYFVPNMDETYYYFTRKFFIFAVGWLGVCFYDFVDLFNLLIQKTYELFHEVSRK